MNRLAAYFLIGVAVLLGGGSLLLFGVFVIVGPVAGIRFHATESQRLLWNGLLSAAFFIQHSGMIRDWFRDRLARLVPRGYHPAIYAAASGIVLAAVVLLWQPSSTVVYQARGLLRLLARVVALLAIAGFSWAMWSLGHDFDPFGAAHVRARLNRTPLPAGDFVLRGPYVWIRHPFYSFGIVLMWCAPDVTLDRVLFNVLWTLWIVLGAYLEGRDLLARFGQTYQDYRKAVAMFYPFGWH